MLYCLFLYSHYLTELKKTFYSHKVFVRKLSKFKNVDFNSCNMLCTCTFVCLLNTPPLSCINFASLGTYLPYAPVAKFL